MAGWFAAKPEGRSQQGSEAEAWDPWEDSAAALQSRRSRAQFEPWGTGARASTEAPITDTWGTGATTKATLTNNWGPRASRETPVTETWWPRASRGAPFADGLGTGASEAAWDAWVPAPSAAAGNWGRSASERPHFTAPPASGSEVLMNITLGNANAFLHCAACSLPLKPPVFQCDAGHAVCSACRDEPLDRGTGLTCNACRGPVNRRCRFMDGLLESLRVACPNAAHGCDATQPYYDLHAHRTACAHAPGTRCPVPACVFVATMAELLDHFTAVHQWPHTAEERAGRSFDIVLSDGVNVVAAAVRDGSDQQHLLLLNVVRQPVGRAISAVCVHPRQAAVTETVQLELRYWAARHYQESEFNVPFVDLADGLPSDLAQFVVPMSVHPDEDILVTAFLTIR